MDRESMNKTISLILMSGVVSSLWGTTYTWSAASGGAWTTDTNWTPNTGYPNGTSDVAQFSSSSTNFMYTGITGITINELSIGGSSSNYLLQGSGLTLGGTSPLITLSGTANSATIQVPITLGADLTIDDGSNGFLDFNDPISGNYGLIIANTGSGQVQLAVSNTFTGSVTINSGTLNLVVANALPSASTNGVTVNGELYVQGNNTIYSLSGTGTVTGSVSQTLTIKAPSSFSGTITGPLGIRLNSGAQLTLNTTGNNYTGATTVSSGGTITAGAVNSLPSASAIAVAGTMDLNGYSNAISSISGSGTVTSATSATLTINNSSSFSGPMINALGVALSSGANLTLAGTGNSYTGATTISSTGTITAGAVNSLPSASAIAVAGTMNLNGYSNTISSFSGSGTVTSATSATLTINNSSSFSGSMINALGVALSSGTNLTLTGTGNSYTGTTTIPVGGTITAGAVNSLPSASNITVDGVLAMVSYSNAIGGLYGSGLVSTTSSSAVLTVNNGGSFSGQMPDNSTTPLSSLNLTSGTLQFLANTQTYSYPFTGSGGIQLSSPTSGHNCNIVLQATNNTYTGGTQIDLSNTLTAGAVNSLPSASAIAVAGTMNLNGYSNAISSISGSGTVTSATSATLTINNSSSFSGQITNALGITLNNGANLILTGTNNNYTGLTTITNGTLQAGVSNPLPTTTDVLFGANGTLNLSSYSVQVNSVSGSGAINTGATGALLILANGSHPSTGQNSFTGPITGSGGITVNGSALILGSAAGVNTYSGPTLINPGATMQAAGVDAFPNNSPITLYGNSTLDLQGNNNQIEQLYGDLDSNVLMEGAQLQIANGGLYQGVISGTGNLVSEGNFTLEGANTFSGGTQISTGTLFLSSSGHLLSTGMVNVYDGATFDISQISSSITNIGTLVSTGGSHTSVVNLGDKQLQTNPTVSSATFSGAIQGTGGSLTLNGNLAGGTTLTLSGSNNTYSGTTLITGSASSTAVLEINTSGALSPNTSVVVNPYGTLLLSPGTTNQAVSLSVSGGTVNNIAGSHTTTVTNIDLTSGTFSNTGSTTLAFSSFTMSGGTLTNGAANSIDTSSIGSPTTSQDGSFLFTGGTIDNYSTFYVTSYTQNSSSGTSILNMGFSETGLNNSPIVQPVIHCTETATLSGVFNVTNSGAAPTSGYAGYYPLISANNISGAFSSGTISGFAVSTQPTLYYTSSALYLFFASQNASWGVNASGSWGLASNWTGDQVPDGNNAIATFDDAFAGSTSPIVVTLSDMTGTLSFSPTIYNINLDSTVHSYTIEQFSTSSVLTFASASGLDAQIAVSAGTHEIDAPLNLDFANVGLEAYLADGTTLTFGTNTTMISTSTNAEAAYFNIAQSNASTLGTGELINYGNLTPNAIYHYSATLTNYGTINPGIFGGYAEVGDHASINNSGVGAVISSTLTGNNGAMYIGYDGDLVVVNDGTKASFGPSANGQTMYVNVLGAGNTTITNSGANATFGPTGSNGNFVMTGLSSPTGTLSVTNTGYGRLMGAFGTGSTVQVSYGTVYNNLGAIFLAGSGGSLTISGGAVINDLSSTVGATDQNVTLTSGLLETSGSVLAFNYSQSSPATLQINLTSLPNTVGLVSANAIASLGGNFTVNALSGCNFPSGNTVTLIEAQRGVQGEFSLVDYLGFPDTINPSITYLLNSVVLDVNPTVSSSTSAGSVPEFSLIGTNQNNLRLSRMITHLHDRVKVEKKNQLSSISSASETTAFEARNEEALLVQKLDRRLHELHTNEQQKPVRPWNFYMGPIDSVGSINSYGSTQARVCYNSIGALAGFDYAFSQGGIGFSAAYANVSGTVVHGGSLNLNSLHGSLYGLYAPHGLEQLGISAILGGGYEWNSIHRKAGPSPTVTAHGHPQGQEVDGLIGVEYIFSKSQYSAFPANFELIPLANIQYICAWVPSYNETGAGQFDLHVNHQTAQSLRSLVGARLDYFYTTQDISFRPELDIGWQYEFMDHPRTLGFATTNLTTTKTVNTQVIGAHGSTLWLGVDLLLTVNQVFEFEASYDLQWNSFYLNNAFYLGLGGNF